MEYIRSTKTGSYWRLMDGRIGYVTPHYARVTVLREGFRNNKWYSEPNKTTDRFYQINKKKTIVREFEWGGEIRKFNGYEREYFANQMEGLNALKDFEERNCTPLATYKRRFKELKNRIEFMLEYQYNDNNWREAYNNLKNQLHKLLLNE